MEIIIGAIVGFIVGALVIRNNAAKVEKLIDKAEESIEKLKK